MDQDRYAELLALAQAMGHQFEDLEFLEQALRHSSWVHENPGQGVVSNERLEFLGDAVLELVVTERLFHLYPGASEGRLSKARSAVVNEARLATIAGQLGLGDMLLLGRGETQQGGGQKPSILADTMEAVVAAVYLDAGLEAARRVLYQHLGVAMDTALERAVRKDYKTRLQEEVQELLRITPRYELVEAVGPDHAKVFTVALEVDGRQVATGSGRSKKEAEQDAARQALGNWSQPEGC